jgi:hypothetical protein
MPIGESVMRETLLALAYPLVLAASALCVGCSCWWRRMQRRRGRAAQEVFPGFRPLPRPRRPSLVACVEREYAALREAENVVFAANAELAHLYLEPEEESAGVEALEAAARAHSLFRP